MDLEIEGKADNERPRGKWVLFGGEVVVRASKLNISHVRDALTFCFTF